MEKQKQNKARRKISAVVPAHNEEANIARVITALLAQDYPEFEIVVVDNASADRTGEIARGFAARVAADGFPSRLFVIHEPRKGLLSAREAGRKAASGHIIANIDADCLPDPDWLSRGAAHFDDPLVVAVTGPYDYHDGGALFRNLSLITQRHIYRPLSLFLQHPLVRKGAVLIGGNNFIRADVLESLGGYDTSILFYGEDTDTAKKVSSRGRVHFNPKLAMKTSARRFKAEGSLNLMLKYWFHFAKVIASRSKGKKKAS